ncbi:hypothetical protein Trisim1_009492 [Trichoderma cf. simile WF8]
MTTLETHAFSAWYTSTGLSESSIDAQGIFEEAMAEFSAELSKDKKQQQWIIDSKHANFESVLASIQAAQAYYEERKVNSKLRKTLVKLSEKLYNYIGIMDVLLPQQPNTRLLHTAL